MVKDARTLYAYDADSRQPAHILVTEKSENDDDGKELDINGSMELNSAWSAVTSAANNQVDSQSGQVDTGDYAWYVNNAAQNDGIQADLPMVAGKTYVIAARVYPVNSGDQVKMAIAGTTDFDVLSASDGAWEDLRVIQVASSGGTKQLTFVANSANATFYVDSVHVF